LQQDTQWDLLFELTSETKALFLVYDAADLVEHKNQVAAATKLKALGWCAKHIAISQEEASVCDLQGLESGSS